MTEPLESNSGGGVGFGKMRPMIGNKDELLESLIKRITELESRFADEDSREVAAGAGGPPTGTIAIFGSLTAPTDWLVCDGAAVSRTTYADLFALIGTTFGVGDGSTTFNLPNLKSRAPMGYNSGDANHNANGKTGGSATQTLSIANLPAHRHSIEYSTGPGGDNSRHITGVTAGGGYAGTETDDVLNTGSGTAHNNLSPYISVQFIIKT